MKEGRRGDRERGALERRKERERGGGKEGGKKERRALRGEERERERD